MKDLSSSGRSEKEFIEKQVHQSNENLNTLFNAIDEFIFIVNEHGHIIQTNTIVNIRLGFTNEELYGKPFLIVFPPEFHDEAKIKYGEKMKESADFYRIPLLSKSGIKIPVETKISRGLWNGTPANFIVSNDISKFSEDNFFNIFHFNPFASGLMNSDHSIFMEVNEAFFTLFGYDKVSDVVIGKTPWDLGLIGKEQLVSIFNKADLQGGLFNAEAILKTKCGDTKYILLSIESIRIQDRKYRLTLFYDITERKTAEGMLQDVIEKNPMSMQIIDKNGFTVKVNQAHTLLFGALFPSDYSVFNDPQLIQSGFTELFVRLKKGEIVHFPDAYYNTHNINPQIPDMSIYLKVIGFPINFRNEEPEHFVLMHENITNRRMADEALRKSENLFRSVVHNSSDLIIFTDERGILRYVSPQCKRVLGYPSSKFIGATLQDIIHPEDRVVYQHAWETTFNYGQEEHDFIYKIIDDQKKVRWISQNSKLLKDKEINIGIQSTLRDITEQRQSEEALRESEEKYRLLFENATQSIAVVQDYKIRFANPKCHEVLGFPMKELLNKPFSDFVYPDDRKMVYENYLKRIQGKPVPAYVFRVLRKDQLVRWVEESGVRIKWHGNDASFIFLSDLTIRKKAEEELNNSLEELHQLTQHMQEVREQERMGISRELHDDLGQALTAVKIDLGMIKQEVSDATIIHKIEKVSSLVSDTIKTVQRLTSNLRPDIINDLGLETAIEWYTKEYAQRSGVKVFLSIDPGIEFSPDTSLNVFRIIQESLTNISRHSKATQVNIMIKKTSESYSFVISDNGIGISENEIKSKRSFGIMSMKERAASLGGTFEIRNNKKNGTEIKIILPLFKK